MPKEKTVDRVFKVLEKNPNATSADVSRLLGLSRQRISQVCRAHGIRLSRAYPRRDAPPRTPAPRVITGGVPSKIGHTAAGVVSELLTIADLTARGYKPYTPVVKQQSHDIIAVTPSGSLLTFEVRSGKRNENGALKYNSKGKAMKSDHYAIVVTGEPVVYRPELSGDSPLKAHS